MDNYASPTRITMTPQGHGSVEYGGDSNMVVMFYTHAEKNEIASREAGAPVFSNVPYVRMHPPGEHLNVIVRPVQPHDRDRFPRQWQQYVLNKTQVPDGTPIDLLFPNNPALGETLKARGIYTIQQLAGLSANGIDSIGMGGQDHVTKAQNYIKNANGGAGFTELQKQLTDKDGVIRSLQNQLNTQKRQIEDLFAKVGNPNAHSLSPKFVPGYDAQAERINANSPTAQILQAGKSTKDGSGAMAAGPIADVTEHKLLQDALVGDVNDIDI